MHAEEPPIPDRSPNVVSAVLSMVPRLRDAAFVLVPAAYVLGFLAWGRYSVEMGLGFLHLEVAQYLITGALLLAIMGVGLGAQWAVFELPKILGKTGEYATGWGAWARAWLAGLIVALGVVLVFGLPYRIVHPNIEDSKNLAVQVVIAGVIMSLVFPFVDLWIRRYITTTPPVTTEPAKREAERRLGVKFRVFALVLAWISIGLTLAPSFLPMVESDLGGARPREAILYVRPTDLPLEIAWEIMEDVPPLPNSTAALEPAPTRKMTVLFDDAEWLLVRRTDHAGGNDPLYEIPKSAVAIIRWFD